MVNRFTDCNSIALQADGKGDFPDHVAGTGTDDGAAQFAPLVRSNRSLVIP